MVRPSRDDISVGVTASQNQLTFDRRRPGQIAHQGKRIGKDGVTRDGQLRPVTRCQDDGSKVLNHWRSALATREYRCPERPAGAGYAASHIAPGYAKRNAGYINHRSCDGGTTISGPRRESERAPQSERFCCVFHVSESSISGDPCVANKVISFEPVFKELVVIPLA